MNQYPFIDIAVHERVRERFARGEALVLFSADLKRVFWANGAGARIFGNPSIYDFIEQGPVEGDLSYRQMATTAGQVGSPAGPRNFLMRVTSGFERVTVQATVETIAIGGELALLFSAPSGLRPGATKEIARRMIEGLDDPDTHVAVIGDNGAVLASSSGFSGLGVPGHVISMLQEGVRGNSGHLLKRPVHIGPATYPAAIAQISAQPALNILFVIEQQIDAPAGEDHLDARTNEMVDAEIPEPQTAAADDILDVPAVVEDSVPTADVVPPQPVLPDLPQPSRFAFGGTGRPGRFVWRIDAKGIFRDVSPELAVIVGPKAADIDGKSFVDVAQKLGLDPEGRIAALLGKRNTWSGKTVFWPVENSSLMVPVDLAALPTYSRDHEFEGFRGFGVVRMADALEDPQARGQTIFVEELSAEPQMPEPQMPEPPTAAPDVPAATAEPEAGSAEPDPASRDEPPALQMSETPMRRYSDKVIRFEERRHANFTDSLSSEEQAAFREIARKLGPATGGEDKNAPETAPQKPAAAEKPPLLRLIRTSEEQAADALKDDLQAVKSFRGDGDGLTTQVVQQLPLAMLVHTGDRLIYANPEFFRLTGDENLRALEARGGIDGLLDRDDAMNPDSPAMLLVRADGATRPVTAKLQSIKWEGRTALLLALVPAAAEEAVAAPSVAEPVEPAPVAAASEEIGAASAQELAGLRAEVGELRSILETATDGVVVVSADGIIRSLNRSACALFNYDEAEVRGKPFATLFAHESQRAVADYLSGLAGHGVASVLNDGREVIGREATGGRLPLFMTLGKLASSSSYCAVIRDITQWKRTEDDLRNARRAAETANAHKTDFLAKVSHEIRTPLNAIIGFSEMMANERFGPIGNQRYIEYANDISRSGRHVLDIVNDLLDISKIEAGEMDLDFAAVRLNNAVLEAVSLLQPQANTQRVIVRTALSDRLPEIVADFRSIKQIAINILANAIKFTPSGGQIVVSTAYEPNGSVVLRIRDTGIGMSRDELEQAMKPFKQAPSGASRTRGEGTGLGLPLTKAMTEANRATFAVSSTPNEGTLVEIAFPSQRVLAN